MSPRRSGRVRAAGLLAAGATSAAWWWIRQSPVAADPAWTRHNFRDREVSLLLGPAVAVGVTIGAATAAPKSRRMAVAAAVGVIGLVGAYDDRYGDSHARGLRGHLTALRQGRVTTGLIKLVTMAGVSTLSSARQSRNPIDVALGTVLVAGSANLVNLFDLRPGRAAKVTGAAAAVLSRVGPAPARAVAAAAGGAASAGLVPDLRERAMLGDCGAGALGATIGWSLAVRPSRLTRLAAAAGVVGATLASERTSFSAVIEANPVLHRLDLLGRAR
jgi:UDP-N-acetylmuramyl pentapeptide phosphotransferase/UDP-N-acetylglucosamine-1-phosphate transferase